MNPYKDTITENTIIREFNQFTDESEFVWHRDDSDRIVEIIKGTNWMFQYDDELPFYLNEGDFIKIKKGEWHRIHRGDDSLLIKIINL